MKNVTSKVIRNCIGKIHDPERFNLAPSAFMALVSYVKCITSASIVAYPISINMSINICVL